MTIREYFDNLYMVEDMNDAADYEQTIYRCMEEDPDDFTLWAIENGIDLHAMDEKMGETVLTLWAWDVCGD